MSPSGVRRRLATVLFLDIVGSTAIASELGDARWRVVLARFRQVVRRELKRHGGREQDTTGDGFFATFAEPVQALRGAGAISAAVQELGLDVRSGVHTGECEEIDGTLGGIAVHIAARVMSLAGAAEVVTTGTAKDLVIGSSATFDDRGTVELKGVAGRWSVFTLRSIEVELPSPLDPDVAAERLSVVAVEAHRRRRHAVAVVALGLVLAAIAALEVVGHISGAPAAAPTLVRLDASSGRVASTVSDKQLGCGPCGPNLWVVDGTLWERTGTDGTTIAMRALADGKLTRTLAIPPGTAGLTVRFGAVWVLNPGLVISSAAPSGTVERIDGLSGRVVATILIPGDFRNGAIAAGSDGIWVLDQDGTLTRIDPSSNRISGRFPTGALETYLFSTGAGYEWICECSSNNHDVLRYDAQTRAAKRFPVIQAPQSWRNAGPPAPGPRTFVVGIDGHTGTLWFLHAYRATLIPWNPSTGRQTAPSVGLDGNPIQAVLANGSIWVAAGTVIDKVSLSTGDRKTIALPKGTYANGIAVDQVTDTVWVANSTAPGV
jgi:class 3 adenylate cyclase